jgi:SPP1 family predicted phage head-tail adaptor
MSVVFKAGDYRKRLIFQERSTSQDSFGGQSETWNEVVTVWGEITPLTSREQMAAAAVQVNLSHYIFVRFHPLLADPKAVSAMRVLYGSRIFNLSAPLNTEERNIELVIPAIEGLNKG